MRSTLRRLKRHPRTVISAVVGAVVVTVITLVAWPHDRSAPPVYTPQVRARIYSSFTACLLTGPDGINDAKTAPVWAGMESASSTTRAQVSYLAMQGAQTASNAGAYVDTLAFRGCSVILTSGTTPGQGASARAATLPRIQFITVGAPTAKAANLTPVTTATPAAVTREVATLLTSDVSASTSAP